MDTVNICLKGIEGPSKKSLVFLLSNQKKAKYRIVDDHTDAITIIDIDDYRGRAAWDRIVDSGTPGDRAKVIILGRKPMSTEYGTMLQKPFQPQQLLDAIYRLRSESRNENEPTPGPAAPTGRQGPDTGDRRRISAARKPDQSPRRRGLSRAAAASLNDREIHVFLGTATDVDMDNAHAIENIQYEPGNFLAPIMQGLIKQAVEQNDILWAECCDFDFYIDPRQQYIFTPAREKNLRALGSLPLDRHSVRHKTVSELPENVASTGCRYSFDDFIWRLALASSRGRLPKSASLDQRYQLRRWPNLTRLLLFPHATQISALWIASPKTIREIVTQLGIPQRYVFAFFASASMIEYLRPAGGIDTGHSMSGKGSRHRSLFRRLLDNLSRKHEPARP